MKRLLDQLFGRSLYNRAASQDPGIFYLAPESVWRRVRDPQDISVSIFVVGDENRERVAGRNLGQLFFFSLPLNSSLSMEEVREKTVILRVDKMAYPEDPAKLSLVFFFIGKEELLPKGIMTERGKKNLANIAMIAGLACILYFRYYQVIAWPGIVVGAILVISGLVTQMYFEAKKKREGRE